MRSVLILRPAPGASETAARAREKGLQPIVAPLFALRPLAWEAPDPRRYDAIFLTSASAPRLAGEALRTLTPLRAYAVGDATAAAARAAGFEDVEVGPADGTAMIEAAAAAGVGRALHLCGSDHVPLQHPGVQVERRVVYTADAEHLPAEAERAIALGAVVLVHSPRAARTLAALVPERSKVRLALISAAASEAAGEGWAEKAVAAAPRDEALLELARRLCKNDPPDAAGAGA